MGRRLATIEKREEGGGGGQYLKGGRRVRNTGGTVRRRSFKLKTRPVAGAPPAVLSAVRPDIGEGWRGGERGKREGRG